MVQHRVHPKHLAPRFNKKPNELKSPSSRGLLLRPGRHRGGAPAGQAGVRHAGGRQRSSTTSSTHHQRLHIRDREAEAGANPTSSITIAYTNDSILLAAAKEHKSASECGRPRRRHRCYGAADSARLTSTTPTRRLRAPRAGRPGFRIESLKPDGQKIEKEFRDAIQKRTGSYPLGAHASWPARAVLLRSSSTFEE